MRKLFDVALREAVKRQDSTLVRSIVKFAKEKLLQVGIQRQDLLMLLTDHSYSMIRLLIKSKVQLPTRKPTPLETLKLKKP